MADLRKIAAEAAAAHERRAADEGSSETTGAAALVRASASGPFCPLCHLPAVEQPK